MVTIQTVTFVRPVAAQTSVNTRITNLTATASSNTVTVTGTTEFRDPNSGSFDTLPGVKVTLSWWQASASSTTYMGEVYSDDSTGDFSFTWIGALQPGIYYINAAYAGGDSFQVGNTTYDFDSSETNTQLLVPLQLSMTLDNPTLSIGQGNSATVTVTVTAQNTNNAYPVTLSLSSTGQLFATQTFSPQSGSTPFISKLSLNVLNATQPGTYVITVTATSQQSNLPTATVSTPLQILVQQNTHQISVNVEGLPTNVQTPLNVDNTLIENVGPGTVTITISNNASIVSVSKEIDVGDTRYTCEAYSQSTSGQSVTSFTFNYGTEYKLTMKADLPQTIVSTLLLTVNGTDYDQNSIRPSQGFSDFYPQNSIVDFGFNSTEITTNTVNYKFTGWKDLSTGNLLSPANVTSDGLYEITLTRPYYLEATYEEWVVVSISTNLPPDLSTKLMFGMVGSANRTVAVPGSTKYEAGEYLVGSTFELDVPQNELVVYDAAGDTRYEFQGMSPITPITLSKHTNIQLNYSVEYRILAVSEFPSVIVEPTGGVGWYAPGQVATIRVENSASDQYGIPYAFDGWSGAMTSNDTEFSFRVTGPMEIDAQWTPNWTYLLMMAGLAIGVTAPSSFFVKRKLGQVMAKRRTVRKSPLKKQGGTVAKAQMESEGDLKVYNYIIDRGGSISVKEAMKDLDMSREEISQSIERLKESRMLG